MSRVLRWVRAAVLAATCALLVAPALAPRLGWELVVVGGGSMHPTIPMGSLLLERTPRSHELREGAVITFREHSGVRTTHRIVGVDQVGGRTLLHTQGDANRSRDLRPVEASSVAGLVVRSLPLLGYGAVALESTLGILTVLAVLGSLTVLEAMVRPGSGPGGRRPPRRLPPDGSPGTTG